MEEQKNDYENKIKEKDIEITNLNNKNSEIHKNERKLRKKLDLKEKEIFQLQSRLNSLNNKNSKNDDSSNKVKIAKNINSNSSFYGKEDPLKDYKRISNNNENISNNHNSIDDEIKNKINYDNSNFEILTKKNKTGNKIALIHPNSVHRLNKCNSISKINFKKDIFSEKNSIFNEMNEKLNNNIKPNNNQYINAGNLSTIKKNKNYNTNNNKSNINEYKSNTLNYSSNNIKENKNENIIIENIYNMNNINVNNSIDTIQIDQKGNNYVKINDNKLLLIAQNKPSKLKRTFSALNNQEKNNNMQPHTFHPKEKLKLKRDITPDKLSNYNQNINNSILKINDNSTSRKFYLIKRTPKKNGYKNSMPNIKGLNIYKTNNREINNKFQFLANKIGNNTKLNNNYKLDNYSLLKLNEFKRISPQNKILDDESKFNFNNTNIINNKIIQKEGNINNNIIIINGELVEQNNKDDYPLISINKNNISLKRMSLKNTGPHEINKIKK